MLLTTFVVSMMIDKFRDFAGWFFGSIFLFVGLTNFFSALTGAGNRFIYFLTALMFYVIAALCLPPVVKLTKEKLNLTLNWSQKFVAIFIMVIIASNLGNISRSSSLQTSTQVTTPVPKQEQSSTLPPKKVEPQPEQPKVPPTKQATAPKPQQPEVQEKPRQVAPADDSIPFGEPAMSDDLGFKVLGIKYPQEVTWTDFGNKLDFSGKAVIVEVVVANPSNKTEQLGFRKFRLLDQNGLDFETHPQSSAASKHMGGVTWMDNIRPQAADITYLIFDINPDSQPTYLLTNAGLFKGDLKFKLN
jgi:hypothetical protein